MKRSVLFLALFTLCAGMASAQQLPPGKWWRKPEVITMLSLTEDQQTKLDGIFRTSAIELIDLKADTEKLSIILRGELDQPQLNRQTLQRAAARLSEARGKLFEREVLMLADMRETLSDTQWSRLRMELENRRPMQNQMQQQQQPRQNPMPHRQRPGQRRP